MNATATVSFEDEDGGATSSEASAVAIDNFVVVSNFEDIAESAGVDPSEVSLISPLRFPRFSPPFPPYVMFHN